MTDIEYRINPIAPDDTDAFVNTNPPDRITGLVAGPDGLTCYVTGEDGFYAGATRRGKLRLVRVGDA